MIIEFLGAQGTLLEEEKIVAMVYLDNSIFLGWIAGADTDGIEFGETGGYSGNFDWEEILRIDILHKGKGNEKLLELLMTKGQVKDAGN